jgi:hypothetical protein
LQCDLISWINYCQVGVEDNPHDQLASSVASGFEPVLGGS